MALILKVDLLPGQKLTMLSDKIILKIVKNIFAFSSQGAVFVLRFGPPLTMIPTVWVLKYL